MLRPVSPLGADSVLAYACRNERRLTPPLDRAYRRPADDAVGEGGAGAVSAQGADNQGPEPRPG